MPSDGFMSRMFPWFARAGLVGLRRADLAAPPLAPEPIPPRGSGSWANEWNGASDAVRRAQTHLRNSLGRGTKMAKPVARGSLRIKPLLSARDAQLYVWLADLLETDAPTCTLHARVSLRAFLAVRDPAAADGFLRGLTADFLIADEVGQPVIALLRDDPRDAEAQMRLVDVLLEASLPVLDIPDDPGRTALWNDIRAVLPIV